MVVNTTERRCVKYVQITRDDPKFQVDPNRISVSGASLGGGGAMHVAYHFPQLFASAAASIGWPDPNHHAWLPDLRRVPRPRAWRTDNFGTSGLIPNAGWSNIARRSRRPSSTRSRRTT